MFRYMLLTGLTTLLCVVGATPAFGQAADPVIRQGFFGKWKLDTAKSKIAHSGDDKSIQWRSYEPDGDRVKVAWGSGEGQLGTYSAKCDGTLEQASNGQIRCRQAGSNKIEGEQVDTSDSLHRFYRRTLSSRGKIMTIIWYADEKRRHALDRFVYTKD
jgi:hypothetical protein